MGYDLDPVIREVLNEIGFIRRYEALSEKNRGPVLFKEAKELPAETTIKICRRLGYEAAYHKQENFFKVGMVKEMPDYEISFTICLTYGVAEFIWNVWRNHIPVVAGPWDTYPRIMVSPDVKINPPLFSNEENLEFLLKDAFALYEDFKSALIARYDTGGHDDDKKRHTMDIDEAEAVKVYEPYHDETYFNIKNLPQELQTAFFQACDESDFSSVLDSLEESYDYASIADTNLLLFYSYVELECALSAYVDDFPETIAKMKARLQQLEKTPQVVELLKFMKTAAKKMI